MSLDRTWWLAFCALTAPHLLFLTYDFLIIGKTYWNDTAHYTLQFWVATAMGWEFSDWPVLLHNVGGGFRTHHPSIPQSQLAALYGILFGWPRDSLAGFASFGVILNITVYLAAAAWGAGLAQRLQIPLLVTATTAALAAMQPGNVLTWLSYDHYAALLVPCGLALAGLCTRTGHEAAALKAMFLALGLALSMQYIAVIPLAALALASLMIPRAPVLVSLSKTPAPNWLLFLQILLFGVFIIGFASAALDLPLKLVDAVTHYEISRTFLVTLAVFGALAATYGAWWVSRKFGTTRPARFLANSAGAGLIGWAIGCNLLLVLSWHMGLLAGTKLAQASPMTATDLAQFLFLTRPWLWLVPLTGVLAAAMLVTTAGNDRLIALFILLLIILNIALLPAAPTQQHETGSAGYAAARVLSGLILAVPPLLVWLQKKERRLGTAACGAGLVIAALSVVDHYRIMVQAAAPHRQVAAFLDKELSAYRAANPSSRVFCLNSEMAGRCSVDYTYDYYRIYHDGNINNAPLPYKYGDPSNRYVRSSPPGCHTVHACLGLKAPPSRPFIVLAHRGAVPKALTEAGRPLVVATPVPKDIVILEYR